MHVIDNSNNEIRGGGVTRDAGGDEEQLIKFAWPKCFVNTIYGAKYHPLTFYVIPLLLWQVGTNLLCWHNFEHMRGNS